MKNQQHNSGLGDLHPLEIELIKRLRIKYRYGEITIIVHDGLPQKLKEVTKYEGLSVKLEDMPSEKLSTA